MSKETVAVEKRKVGRPKGARSFVEVTLEDVQKVAGPSTVIPVGRLWWEKVGGTVAPSESPVGVASDGQVDEPLPPIEYTIEE